MKNFKINSTSKLSVFRLVGCFIAMIFVVIALVGLSNKGLALGLDFTGGYLTEFSTEESLSQQDMNNLLSNYLPESFKLTSAEQGTHWSVQQADNNVSLQDKAWLSDFADKNQLNISPQDAIYIGSQVGEDLINQGGLALLTAIIVILMYLSFRFEWRLAAGAVIALFHDVLIVLGLFAWFGIPFDLTILASLLAIVGYSLNDSIIVGDKIREIMKSTHDTTIDEVINQAIKSTLVRTMITSGTTLVTIMAVWGFAGESLAGFSIALFSGILVGTFSSIVIAATVPQLLGLTADYYQQKELEVCPLP
ncbi:MULTISPECIES: protein translocase subunit SecF [unclassified Colwellia]|uniref:protein translocase subunit SecF n=1 Tax=unclassified Colwellia TaxID=196834 RepID=UPI0015F7663A|nr:MULTISPECIES: protein translocase subunit SecF [unclassified Colwellia]MBA6379350.1 protein translocase subunit SecF [Colwellia sp. BRX10-7]MBA6387146.1 protein translocase subunit SecF [Colwellia sp. BRX10-2]MBA6401882.1 protein translocase subunit SecF [Colwellia sp. BRX10-5]MBA6405792.1 protein translocase subunit SecF [Colwellia sp. BRX10-1]